MPSSHAPAARASAQLRPRVLVVEDEQRIRELVCHQLERAGFESHGAADGRDGLQRLLAESFDVVVLDLMLPGVDGMTICRTVRQEGVNRDVPILVLTARRAEADKVEGFTGGADDYVTKPFGVHELTARVAALTRRVRRPHAAGGPAPRRPVALHGVELDPLKHTVRVREAPVSLTPHEFELLFQLASQPGVVLARQQLLALVWHGEAFVTERSVDTLVRHLRCKIEVNPAAPELVLTVWGYGYKFAHA
jgi:two-component system, OmpR family, alkaline phosphatase synthesis response regulator PhoP